jgi:carboxyl-terminal processing protease
MELGMKKSIWIIVGIVTGLLVIVSSFSAGALMGTLFIPQPDIPWIENSPLVPTKEPSSEEIQPDRINALSRDELFAPFWEAWEIVHDQYIDQPVDEVLLMRGAITGMLEALGDRHTTYMDPDQFIQANIPMDGEYEGIGAWVDTTTEYLTIISPMADSPAERSGLLPGDQVIAIDGEDMTGIDGSLVIRRILGPAGTDVILTIVREGEPEPFDVTVTREKIILVSVESEMLDDEIGYVQILTFGAETRQELRKNLNEILEQEPAGLVVDLRNNGGGFLTTAVDVASEFIGKGIILYEDYGSDQELLEFEARRGGLATDIPMVLLVNEGSASASEIVAGAIQDNERGPLVGTVTFGKGSVQNWIPLSNEQGAVRVTVARWLTPNQRQISEVGLEPDYLVELTEEDFENELDPQLDKAVEVLLDLIGN